MSQENKCLKCGSSNLEPSEFRSTGKIYSRPKNAKLMAILTGGVPVTAMTCLDCGHVELLVDANKARLLTATA